MAKSKATQDAEKLCNELNEGWKCGKVPSYRFWVRITFTEDVLGSLPPDEKTQIDFVASKAPTEEARQEEIEAVRRARADYVDENVDPDQAAKDLTKGLTVFARDKNGDPFIYNYVVKGFLKNAAHALKQVPGTLAEKYGRSYKTFIDNIIFTGPRELKVHEFNKDEMRHCSRPLRAYNPGSGQQIVNIISSESIPAGSQIAVQFECLNEDMVGLVEELLDYGQYNGIGCWHNGGKGTFVWELLDNDANVIGGNKQRYDQYINETNAFMEKIFA